MSDQIKRGADERSLAEPVDGWPKFTADALLDDPDLGLITDYLSNELSPEQVERVKRRLAEDEQFRELAAPLLLTWNVPPLWKREPMPRTEIVAAWDQLTQRAGFVHQRDEKRRRRRRWITRILAVIVAALAVLIAILPRGFESEMDPVTAPPDTAGWIDLGQAVRARLQPGATLYRKPPAPGMGVALMLEGSARFVAERSRLANPAFGMFIIYTRAGSIEASGGADFTVRARGDRTYVDVFPREGAPPAFHRDELESVSLQSHDPGGLLDVAAGEEAELRRGLPPIAHGRVYRPSPGYPPVPRGMAELKKDFTSRAILDNARQVVLGRFRITADSGARLFVRPTVDTSNHWRRVWLEGSALVTRASPGGNASLEIYTNAGQVIATDSVGFRVHARGDTTDVEAVQPSPPDPDADPPSVTLVGGDPPTERLDVRAGQRGRLVRGVDPARVRPPRNAFMRWLFE